MHLWSWLSKTKNKQEHFLLHLHFSKHTAVDVKQSIVYIYESNKYWRINQFYSLLIWSVCRSYSLCLYRNQSTHILNFYLWGNVGLVFRNEIQLHTSYSEQKDAISQKINYPLIFPIYFNSESLKYFRVFAQWKFCGRCGM